MALTHAETRPDEDSLREPAERARPRPTARRGWVDRFVEFAEGSAFFDKLAAFGTTALSKVVRPGGVKDALSGTWMGHPLHPLLTDVAIGSWTSGVILDLVPSRQTRAAADALIGLGVAAAAPTAITGLSDLADVEGGEVRAVGGAHALGNVLATGLFAWSWIMRRRGRRGAGIAASLAGTGVATMAGFLGGHLAYRRGIGVDQTAFEDHIEEWTPALRESELKPGRAKRVRLGRNDVLLYRDAGGIRALASRCSHRGGPLQEGSFDGGTVTCPWHQSTFRLDDGSVICGPATAPQPSYDVRIRDGMIEVKSR